MNDQQPTGSGQPQDGGQGDGQEGERQVVIVGPDGQPIGAVPESALALATQTEGNGSRSARSPTWSSSPPR